MADRVARSSPGTRPTTPARAPTCTACSTTAGWPAPARWSSCRSTRASSTARRAASRPTRRLRPALPLPARHRRRLQRLRGAARLHRGRRGRVRRPDPADPQGQQPRPALHGRGRPAAGRHRHRRRRAAPRLRRHRLHHLPRLRRAHRDVRGAARADRSRPRPPAWSSSSGRTRAARSPRRPRPPSTWPPTPPRSPPSSAPTSSRSSRRSTRLTTRRPPRASRRPASSSTRWPTASRHVIQGAFDGRRIVIFSGGAAKGVDEVLEENRQTAARRRLRHDHGPQLVPAPARRGGRAAAQGHGHPRGRRSSGTRHRRRAPGAAR